MQVLHRRLVENSPSYRIWHDSPISSIVHLFVLSAFIFVVVANVTTEPRAQVASTAAVSAPQNQDEDTSFVILGPIPEIVEEVVEAPTSSAIESSEAVEPSALHVTIVRPAAGSIVGTSEIAIESRAGAQSGIQMITISADGTALTNCMGVSSCTFVWPTRSLIPGEHALSATAFDTAGNKVTQTIGVFKE